MFWTWLNDGIFNHITLVHTWKIKHKQIQLVEEFLKVFFFFLLSESIFIELLFDSELLRFLFLYLILSSVLENAGDTAFLKEAPLWPLGLLSLLLTPVLQTLSRRFSDNYQGPYSFFKLFWSGLDWKWRSCQACPQG